MNMAFHGFEFGRGRVATLEEEEPGSMLFADELFGNGQVKPLKLPPRMVMSELGLASPSWTPRSTSGGLKLAFRKMWLEADSDPFQKAAEKVSEGENKWGNSRRSRRHGSVSPLGGVHQWTINDLNLCEDFSHIDRESQSCVWSQSQANPTIINNRIEEPRGLSIARKLRPLSMDQGKDTILQVHKPMSPVKESKHRLTRLLSWRKGIEKWGVKASENELKRRETDVIKTVVQYKSRPKMLLCFGFQKAV